MVSVPGVAAVAAPDSGLGLRAGSARVVPHDPRWPGMVADLASAVSAALTGLEPVVEHIGSTAVPGLVAKPVLDLAVGLAGTIDQDRVRPAMEAIGFAFVADLGIYGGLLFTLGSSEDPDVVVAHVHVVDVADFQWRWYLRFRDGLRSDHDLRDEYAALKIRLAQTFVDDRQGYTKAKSDWVLATVQVLDRLA